MKPSNENSRFISVLSVILHALSPLLLSLIFVIGIVTLQAFGSDPNADEIQAMLYAHRWHFASVVWGAVGLMVVRYTLLRAQANEARSDNT